MEGQRGREGGRDRARARARERERERITAASALPVQSPTRGSMSRTGKL